MRAHGAGVAPVVRLARVEQARGPGDRPRCEVDAGELRAVEAAQRQAAVEDEELAGPARPRAFTATAPAAAQRRTSADARAYTLERSESMCSAGDTVSYQPALTATSRRRPRAAAPGRARRAAAPVGPAPSSAGPPRHIRRDPTPPSSPPSLLHPDLLRPEPARLRRGLRARPSAGHSCLLLDHWQPAKARFEVARTMDSWRLQRVTPSAPRPPRACRSGDPFGAPPAARVSIG